MTEIQKLLNEAGAGGLTLDDIPRDGTGVVKLDPWLEPFNEALKRRYGNPRIGSTESKH
ncbi:alpha-1,4-glucan branching enzyme [Metarhizium acridum]|nr:alpha-1,4-glucan branching enzyme [Metarhizium acridum]